MQLIYKVMKYKQIPIDLSKVIIFIRKKVTSMDADRSGILPENIYINPGHENRDISAQKKGHMPAGARAVSQNFQDATHRAEAKLQSSISEGTQAVTGKRLLECTSRFYPNSAKHTNNLAQDFFTYGLTQKSAIQAEEAFIKAVGKRENIKRVPKGQENVIEAGIKQLQLEKPSHKIIYDLYQNEGPTLLTRGLLTRQGQHELLGKLFEAKSLDPTVIKLIEQGKLDLAVKKQHEISQSSKYVDSLNPAIPLDRRLLEMHSQEGTTPLFIHLCEAKLGATSVDTHIIAIFEKEGASPLVQKLLLARSRNEKSLPALLEKQDPVLMRLIEEGRFALAEDRMNASDSASWTKSTCSGLVMQKLHDLERDLGNKLELMQALQNFATNNTDEKTVKAFGQMQFLLTRSRGVEEVFHALKTDQLDELSTHELGELMRAGSRIEYAETAKFCHQLAEILLSPSGCLNTVMLDPIIDIITNNIDIEKTIKETIILKLHALQNHVEFSDRLAMNPVPKDNTRQATLIRAMLQKEPTEALTSREINSAILSALVWPLRQHSTIGSCFATSIVIQQGSHAEGMKQILEDLLSLVGNGCLTRAVQIPQKGTLDTPLVIPNIEEFCQKFQNDNLLARAHEFTTTNIGGAKLAGRLIGPGGAIRLIGQTIANRLSNPLLQQVVEANCCTILSPERNKWISISTQTGQALDSMSVDEAAQFFGAMIDDPALKEYCESPEFKKLLKQQSFTINAGTGADHIGTLLSTDVEETKVQIDIARSFEDLFNLVATWSESDKNYARQNPGLLIPFATPNHAFSLRANELINLYDASQGDVSNMDRTNTFIHSELSEELAAQFLDQYVKLYTQHSKTNPMTDEELVQYKDEIHKELFTNRQPTIETLYEVMKKQDYNTFWSKSLETLWSQRLEQVLRSLPAVQDLVPKEYYVLDSNWTSSPQRGFTMSILQNKPIVLTMRSNPFDPRDWSIYSKDKSSHSAYKFQDPVRDPLTRNYYQPRMT